MIKLSDKSLSQASLDYLANRQNIIQGSYSERVKLAKDNWGNFENAAFREIKSQLIAMSPNPSSQRCMYCEDNFADEIEHFRPKDLYPELTFVWANYLLACGRCNGSSKNNKFAIFDSTGKFVDITRPRQAPVLEPSAGEPVLINPRYEDPLDFLQINFLDNFEIRPKIHLSQRDEERAKYTITTLQLNRSELARGRETAFTTYMDWLWRYKQLKDLGDTIRLIEHQAALHQKHHGMVWELLRRFYIERNPSHWEKTLKPKYSFVTDIDNFFSNNPELLAISFMSM